MLLHKDYLKAVKEHSVIYIRWHIVLPPLFFCHLFCHLFILCNIS